MHSRLRRFAIIGLCLLITAAASGCYQIRSAREDFERDKERLQAAATYALSKPIADSEKMAPVKLPARFRDLAVHGQVWHIRKDGREFVFFPQTIDGQTIYKGLLYSPDAGLPDDVLVGQILEFEPHWWDGKLSGYFLA